MHDKAMSSVANPHKELRTPLYILCTYVYICTWNEKTHWLITAYPQRGITVCTCHTGASLPGVLKHNARLSCMYNTITILLYITILYTFNQETPATGTTFHSYKAMYDNTSIL